MTISSAFFGPASQKDRFLDMQYCKQNGIDTENKSRDEIKAAIISNMTGMDTDQAKSFYTNRGQEDRMLDLQALNQLGIEPTGNREENKAAILNSLNIMA